jgi:HAD superfamily hydrolase (TIGR01549 family)
MKKQKEIDWIFFDVGGVLTDDSESEEWRKQIDFEVLYDYDKSITRKMIDEAFALGSSIVGGTDDNLIKIIIQDKNEAEKLIHKVRSLKAERWPTMKDFSERSPTMPDALVVVRELSKSYKLGIIANQPYETLERLKREGLSDYFENIGISAKKGFHKPDIKFFESILEEVGADPQKSVMIDDNIERGLFPAKKLGMKTVWFDPGIKRSVPIWVDYKIKNFKEILSIF